MSNKNKKIADMKVSDIKEDDVLKGFVALAEIGVHNKEDIQNKCDELEAIIDDYNAHDCVLTQGLNEYDEAASINHEDRLKELDEEYGSYQLLFEKRNKVNSERTKYSNYLTSLQAALENYKNFDKSICFSNIRYLLSQNPDIKIGQIEREANVRLGYTSRLEKPDNTAEPSVEFIVSAAKLLNVSLDVLVSVDLQSLTPTGKYLVSFSDKLKRDTLADKLEWNIESEDSLRRPDCDSFGNPDHPMLSYESFYDEGETEYPELQERVTFVSHSFGPQTGFDGDSYSLRLKNGAIFYLMSISKSVYRIGDPTAFVKEAWMYSPKNGKQFLFASNDGTALAPIATELYEIVREHNKHPKLKKDIKDAIDSFMNDDMDDDEEELSYCSDDVLPFN